MFSIKRTVYPFIIPALLIILSATMLWKWPDIIQKVNEIKELRAFLLILPVIPYAVFCIGILMGWRYNNTGLVMASFILALSYFTLSRFGPDTLSQRGNALSVTKAMALLLPLNLTFFSTLTKRRIFTSTGIFCFFLIIAQAFAVVLFCNWAYAPDSWLLLITNKSFPLIAKKFPALSSWLGSVFHGNHFFTFKNIFMPSIIAFCGALLFLMIQFLYTKNLLLVGFAGALVSTFFGVTAGKFIPSAMIYFTVAGLILIITTIEASFSMAYIDELTGLQGRRSLNETLINLGQNYAAAMIDVDHFKKFNDTYGHKTGDQVLKMIATNLEKITGGAKTFRYGGEEFTAIFPGKSAEEALPHLEKYRQVVASTPFVVRSKQRRKNKPKSKRKIKTSGQKQVHVTVSIGVSEPDKHLTDPEKVLKTADKILYKAKKAGRNIVMQ